MQAKDVYGSRGAMAAADLEEKIVQRTNRVRDVASLKTWSYYWIALASNITFKLETGSATETQSLIKSIVLTSSGKTLMLARFEEGSYVLKLFINNQLIRSISIFAAPKR